VKNDDNPHPPLRPAPAESPSGRRRDIFDNVHCFFLQDAHAMRYQK
jgi:hypothetical protein